MEGEVDGWYLPSLDGVPGARTMALIGRSGNGKSATGNTILVKPAFKSGLSMSDITRNHESQTATLQNGEIINVVDTPGLIDVGSECINQKIAKCLELAKGGIHAFLLVLSVGTSLRFTEKEAEIIMKLQTVFGYNVTDYMIVVFTGGDRLEKDQTLGDFLVNGCSSPLRKIVRACKNRAVLFDNATMDKKKKSSQRRELLSLVDKVVDENGGRPYTRKLCSEEAKASSEVIVQDPIEVIEKMKKSYDEQLNQIMEMFESKLKEAKEKFEQQLAEEKASRLDAEKVTQKAITKVESKLKETNKQAKKLKDDLKEVKDNPLSMTMKPFIHFKD